MRIARDRRQVEVITHDPQQAGTACPPSPSGSRFSAVNRVVSRRLAHKGKWPADTDGAFPAEEAVIERRSGVGLFRRVKRDNGETIWHLSECHEKTAQTS